MHEKPTSLGHDTGAPGGGAMAASVGRGTSTLMRSPRMVLAAGAAIVACLDEAQRARKS